MTDSLSSKSETAESLFEYVFTYITYVFNTFRNQTFKKVLLELIERRPRFYEKNMSHKLLLNYGK